MLNVYVVNKPERKERLQHISKEFNGKKEFDVKVIQPIKHELPAVSLWLTIKQIIKNEIDIVDDYFIFCEDDHRFTDYYNSDFLKECIKEAKNLDADILSGGVSWQNTSVLITPHLYWFEHFSGLQFTIIFKKFYPSILEVEFRKTDTADCKISALTDKKFGIYPLISIQKEFGYSDVTPSNNSIGRVDYLFDKTIQIMDYLNEVRKYYFFSSQYTTPRINFSETALPVYVIHLKERQERLRHLKLQFKGKDEFDINIIEAVKDENGRRGLWNSILKTVHKAIENEDDFFILCEDDHCFTESYNRDILIENIFQAHYYKVDILSGGIGGFGIAAPVGRNRYWIDWLWCTQFVVVYKQFYEKILQYDFQEQDTADGVFSKLSNNKNVIYPFISTQKDFGYSDVTKINNDVKGLITKFFKEADKRLAIYHHTSKMYLNRNKIRTGSDN